MRPFSFLWFGAEMYTKSHGSRYDDLIEFQEITMADHVTGPKYQILLAEDDEVNQDIVKAFLAGNPELVLTVACDGREAIEAALARKFDLMILDQQMPYITGDRVLLHLRVARSVNAATPVIRFTAAAESRPVEIRHTNGVAEAVLPKPLGKGALLTTLFTLLGRP